MARKTKEEAIERAESIFKEQEYIYSTVSRQDSSKGRKKELFFGPDGKATIRYITL